MHNTDSIFSSPMPSKGSHLEQAATLAVSRSTAGVNGTKRSQAPRSNVISDYEHRDSIANALSDIATVVGRTLGPHGSNTLIRDEFGLHIATKDGYTVLQRLTYVQETATMVLDHVRSVSRSMVRKVGDGSTSAVIMADSLYQSLLESELLQAMPAGPVQSTLNALADIIANRITKISKPVTTYEDILAVATVSANNDPWAGKLVADAYLKGGDNANVFVGIGGDTTEIRKEPGYRVLRGMVDECFANEVGIDGSTKTNCRLKDSKVLVYGDVIDQSAFNTVIAPVMNEAIATGKPFTIVAKEYTSDVLSIVANFKRNSPGIQLLFVDHANATRRGAARLGDLATVLGCKTVEAGTAISMDMLGSAVEIRSTGSETVFLTSERSEEVIERAKALQEQIDRVDENNHDESMSEELDELKARIRALLGSEVTIFIGGATDLEKKTLQYLLDDASLAVAAAKKGGIVEGLGMATLRQDWSDLGLELGSTLINRLLLPKAQIATLVTEVIIAVRSAYVKCFTKVLNNSRVKDVDAVLEKCVTENLAYNALSCEFTPVSAVKVVNPAYTDIEVIRGAMSIVGLFLASDQTLLTRPRAGGNLD